VGQENTEVAKSLKSEIDELDASLKEVDASVGQNQRNVGNYSESVREAIESTGAFDEVLGGLSKIQQVLAAFTKVTANETEEFADKTEDAAKSQTVLQRGLRLTGRGLKRLKTAIAATGIGLLLTSLASVASFFSNTAAGSRKLAGTLGGLSAVVSNLTGRFATFGGAIVDQVQAATASFRGLGKFLRGDFKGAQEEYINRIRQQASSTKRLKESVSDLGKETREAFEAGKELAELRFYSRENIRAIGLEVAELQKLSQTQQAIADDATRSFKQRRSAGIEAAKAGEEAARKQLELAKQEEDFARRAAEIATQRGKRDEEALDALNEATIQRIEAEKELSLSTEENIRFRRELKQDELEKDLDILIDGLDNQKTINERIIADDRTTLGEKIDVFRSTEKKAQESFNKQIETIQKFTNKRIEADKLLATSDAVLLNQRIRSLGLSEIIEGRLLEVIRERRTLLQDISDLERDLQEIREESAREARGTQETINQIEQEQSKRRIELADDASKKEIALLKEKAKLSGDVSDAELEQLKNDLDTEFELRKNALIASAEFELSNEELTAEEKELINERLNNDLARLGDDRVEQEKKTQEQIEALNKKTQEQIKKENRETNAEIASQSIKVLDDISKKREQAIDKDISDNQDRLNQLQALAAEGQQDAQDSLAAAQRREAELQRQKLEEQKKQERAQIALAALQTYSAGLDAGQTPGQSFANAIALSGQLLAAVEGFYHGTDDTGDGSGAVLRDKHGAITGYTHKNEQVWSEKDRSEVGYRTREEIKSIVNMHERGLTPFNHEILALNGLTKAEAQAVSGSVSHSNSKMELLLKQNINAINSLPNKMPGVHFGAAEIAGVIKETIERDGRTERIYHALDERSIFKK